MFEFLVIFVLWQADKSKSKQIWIIYFIFPPIQHVNFIVTTTITLHQHKWFVLILDNY